MRYKDLYRLLNGIVILILIPFIIYQLKGYYESNERLHLVIIFFLIISLMVSIKGLIKGE